MNAFVVRHIAFTAAILPANAVVAANGLNNNANNNTRNHGRAGV
ncbi:hypothetical protein [Dyella psychrodurans]|nr:hypothetical protein [Dyella psychrodurans]